MKIFITDTHFGAKNNSISFFEGQLKFFKEQLIPYIEQQNEEVTLFHLGDVFDSRSTISIHIAWRVKELFDELCQVCRRVVVIPGNHDFLQQRESELHYNSPNLILQPYDIEVVEEATYDDIACFDWYKFKDLEHVKEVCLRKEIKMICCHDDIFALPEDFKQFIKDNKIKLLSGHIHQSRIEGYFWNLGATCPKDFSDANDAKYAYIFKDDLTYLGTIENTKSVRFWRLYEDDIKYFNDEINPYDKIEIYLPKEKILTDAYKSELEVISSKFSVILIPVEELEITESETKKIEVEDFDINKLILESIPDDCKEIFNEIIK